MEESSKKEQGKEKVSKVKTFTVPYTSIEIKDNTSISTNNRMHPSTEQIINQAISFHSKGNILKAKKYYQYLINQELKDFRVFSNYGVIMKNLGKLKEAELFYRKAIKLNPNFAEAYSNLGIMLKDLGKLEEAETAYRKAITLNPNFADAYSNLGIILKDLGKLEEAEIAYRKAIELNPHFAIAYSNLGNIFSDIGKLKEAEIAYQKAIELNPKDKIFKNNLINLLTMYKPKKIDSNPLYIINEEFKKLNLCYKDNFLITDNEAIKIYKDGLQIYKNYNLNLETNLSQIYIKNEDNFNCKRHKLIFNRYKVIPEFCFSCYKVQIEVGSIIELIKLCLVFNQLKLKNNNTRKSIIELRPNISGFYKGLIYCSDLHEALQISKKINIQVQKNIRTNLRSEVKRGCSEYPLEFPQYKEIRVSGDQPMNYNENWRDIEKEMDKGNKEWGKQINSIEGFNLNDFLIMRNWIAYAQKIGDQSVRKITNEQIKGPKAFNSLKKTLISSERRTNNLIPDCK